MKIYTEVMRDCFNGFLQTKEHRLDRKSIINIPLKPGVYGFFYKGKCLYFGRTSENSNEGLLGRIKQHLNQNTSSDLVNAIVTREKQFQERKNARKWVRENCTIRFMVIKSSSNRRWLEHYAIGVLHPKHNLG